MESANLEYIKNLTENNEEFERELISILKRDFPIEYDGYKLNIEEKNYSGAAEIVHKIKHKITILGFKKGYELASNHENELRNGKSELKDSFKKILDNISAFIKTL
ncbi:MAG: Hpt domain-containing protein [Flavobacteriaceae bacterium]|nr:Hpt domain-containing protein [Flavobacteriaceae bacterium]